MLISINPKVLSINPKRKVSSEKVMFKSAWTRCETNIKVSSTFLKLKMNSKHNQTSGLHLGIRILYTFEYSLPVREH